jgi:hypothetical protein
MTKRPTPGPTSESDGASLYVFARAGGGFQVSMQYD